MRRVVQWVWPAMHLLSRKIASITISKMNLALRAPPVLLEHGLLLIVRGVLPDEVVAVELAVGRGGECGRVLLALLVHLVEERDLVEVVLRLADHVGDEGRLHLLRLQPAPLHALQERVLLQLPRPPPPQPLQRVLLQQTVYQVQQLGGKLSRQLELTQADLFVQ
jgi:hypothetical protein